jgi:hypothetical protein
MFCTSAFVARDEVDLMNDLPRIETSGMKDASLAACAAADADCFERLMNAHARGTAPDTGRDHRTDGPSQAHRQGASGASKHPDHAGARTKAQADAPPLPVRQPCAHVAERGDTFWGLAGREPKDMKVKGGIKGKVREIQKLNPHVLARRIPIGYPIKLPPKACQHPASQALPDKRQAPQKQSVQQLPVRQPASNETTPSTNPAAAPTTAKDPVGSGHYEITDLGFNLKDVGLKAKVTQSVSLAAGIYANEFCDLAGSLIMRAKGKGLALCTALGGVVGTGVYLFSDSVIPDKVRIREINANGQIRPGEGDVDYHMMSLGFQWGLGEGLASKDLKGSLKQLAVAMAAAEAYNEMAAGLGDQDGHHQLPLSLVTTLFRPGFDWEFDIACTNKGIETGLCTLGVRLSPVGNINGQLTKATSAVQVPAAIRKELIGAYMSSDPAVKYRAAAQIMADHFFDQPVQSALRAAARDLGIVDFTAKEILPGPGSYVFSRFGTENELISASGSLSVKGVPLKGQPFKVGWSPMVQAGIVTRYEGDRYFSIRLLNTFPVSVGPISYKPQSGPQYMVKIGVEGSPDNAKAIHQGLIEVSRKAAEGEWGVTGQAIVRGLISDTMQSLHLFNLTPEERAALRAEFAASH